MSAALYAAPPDTPIQSSDGLQSRQARAAHGWWVRLMRRSGSPKGQGGLDGRNLLDVRPRQRDTSGSAAECRRQAGGLAHRRAAAYWSRRDVAVLATRGVWFDCKRGDRTGGRQSQRIPIPVSGTQRRRSWQCARGDASCVLDGGGSRGADPGGWAVLGLSLWRTGLHALLTSRGRAVG
jgi:hypothetical protein